MTTRNKLFATACAITLFTTSPAMSDPQSTKILEDLFDVLKAAPITLDVGDKDEKARYTQWNNITLKTNDGQAQVAIPWIKVSKKILGGHELVMAEQFDAVLQSPNPGVLEPVTITIENKDTVVVIDGKEGARNYISSYGEVSVHITDNDNIEITMKLIDGTGSQRTLSGDRGKSSGSFNVKELEIVSALNIEGETMSSSSTMQGLAGEYEFPIYTNFDPEHPNAFFDATRDAFIAYGFDSGDTKISMMSPMGPIDINSSFGVSSGEIGITNSMATLMGNTNELSYDMLATQAGFPPMQISIDEVVTNIAIPLDNVDESMPANFRVAINNLSISNGIWMMFDPKALLPRETISLDIDLLAGVRWLKKISELDVKNPEKAPPVEVENAEIRAFNVKIAGAELQTTGSVMIDNSQFPPVPDGTVNISLDGAYGLLGKLTELGLVPQENAMMIQGMAAMFFKPGDGGDDSLVSTITMTKDGHISANGMPLK